MTATVESSTPLAQSTPRRISILGATGSIGTSTLDVMSHHADAFEVVALVGNSNIDLLAEQARAHKAQLAVTADASLYDALRDALAGTGIEVAAGPHAVVEAAERDADMVMAAIVGAAGLEPTLAAVRRGAAIALANKECLVSAGDLFMAEATRHGVDLLPVDSEHNAIFQVLDTHNVGQISRIILTASGGPFRTWTLEEIAAATPEKALKHPNWSMGPKITIDSASMMNKGLELIEAFHLFPARLDQLDVLVHPQSVVHSMVEYEDGSVLAQLGSPDMRTPISYALAWPERIYSPSPRLRLEEIGSLTFEAVDHARFPSISLCRQALAAGRTAPTILNAANEVAVAEFLSKRLSFLDIVRVVERTLEAANRAGMIAPMGKLEDVLAADEYARAAAREVSAALDLQA